MDGSGVHGSDRASTASPARHRVAQSEAMGASRFTQIRRQLSDGTLSSTSVLNRSSLPTRPPVKRRLTLDIVSLTDSRGIKENSSLVNIVGTPLLHVDSADDDRKCPIAVEPTEIVRIRESAVSSRFDEQIEVIQRHHDQILRASEADMEIVRAERDRLLQEKIQDKSYIAILNNSVHELNLTVQLLNTRLQDAEVWTEQVKAEYEKKLKRANKRADSVSPKAISQDMFNTPETRRTQSTVDGWHSEPIVRRFSLPDRFSKKTTPFVLRHEISLLLEKLHQMEDTSSSLSISSHFKELVHSQCNALQQNLEKLRGKFEQVHRDDNEENVFASSARILIFDPIQDLPIESRFCSLNNIVNEIFELQKKGRLDQHTPAGDHILLTSPYFSLRIVTLCSAFELALDQLSECIQDKNDILLLVNRLLASLAEGQLQLLQKETILSQSVQIVDNYSQLTVENQSLSIELEYPSETIVVDSISKLKQLHHSMESFTSDASQRNIKLAQRCHRLETFVETLEHSQRLHDIEHSKVSSCTRITSMITVMFCAVTIIVTILADIFLPTSLNLTGSNPPS